MALGQGPLLVSGLSACPNKVPPLTMQHLPQGLPNLPEPPARASAQCRHVSIPKPLIRPHADRTDIVTIIYTTIALALEVAAVPLLIPQYGLFEQQCTRMAGVVVSGLYIFELTFRFDMRLPL